MRSVGKPSSSRSSRIRRGTIRTGAPSRFTIASRSMVASGRPVDVMTRTAGQQLPGAVHVDTELPEHRRAVGPDGDGATARRHVRPLVEDGDVVSVAQ